MLRNRFVPVLLLSQNNLVKTKKFSRKDRTYLGDPINTVRIFSEFNADEILLLDIEASINHEINFKLLEKIARYSHSPMSYGGGIKNSSDAKCIISFGFEKISISSIFYENLREINNIADAIGSQSLSICFDIYKEDDIYYVSFYNNTLKQKLSLDSAIKLIKDYDFGELILNFVDKDGTFSGYDFSAINLIKEKINQPLFIIGGYNSQLAIDKNLKNLIGFASGLGSHSVFYKNKSNVLINYNLKND